MEFSFVLEITHALVLADMAFNLKQTVHVFLHILFGNVLWKLDQAGLTIRQSEGIYLR